MGSVWTDLRFALRQMARGPGVTAILILTLALGIGASTTIFSVVNSVVLEPLPYKEPGKLVRVYTEFLGRMNLRRFWVSPPEFNDLARQCQSCEAVTAVARGTASFTGGDRPVRVDAAYTTASFAQVMGVRPALGRFYTPDEDRLGDFTVAVISDKLWRTAYGADPGIVGKKVSLDAVPITIIGVMPKGFDYPAGVEAWVPLRLDPNSTRRGSHFLEVTARLKHGVDLAGFRAELDVLMAGWTESIKHHPLSKDRHPIIAFPLKQEVLGSLATTLWVLQAAVLLVLLIAVANVTNLLLARAEARSREIAVRHALGAGRGRLVRQLLTEALALGVLGGALGILVAVWALDATVALIPKSAPRVSEIALDGKALGFALVLTLASSVLFGLAPILHTRKVDLHASLKDGSKSATGSRGRLRVRRALVIGEVALAMVLVIGCGLMVRAFVRLQHVDLGYRADHLLTFAVELPPKAYPDEAVNPFWRRLQDRMKALPGVEGVTVLSGLPPYRPLNANDLFLPDKPRQVPSPFTPPWNTDYLQGVTDDAFATLGARIVRGRALGPGDVEGAPSVVVVNQAFADKFFPGEDAVGKRIVSSGDDEAKSFETIVGVVENIRQAGIDKPAGTEIFFPIWQTAQLFQGSQNTGYVILRTRADPAAMAPLAEQALRELDPTLPASQVRTMDRVLWEAVARPRFLTFLLAAFAVLALALAAIGIYGVMSYTVAQRTHELGIRAALGAQAGQLRMMVLKQGAVITGIGIAVGLVAAFLVEQALASKLASTLYGEKLRDPLLFVEVSAVIAAVALLATWLPARRATRVPPTVALRSE
jgi:putative ABC transport system permease protein